MVYRAVLEKESLHLKSEMPELLDKILSFVEDHLLEEITLDNTAKRFFVSRSTISNIFRKEINISFYRYVTQRRLVAAKNFILEEFPMDSIAEKVGFSDYSSFYRAFKNEYGISPRQFKSQQCI
jgi:AraC-like DNA-binding protein